eukprot:2749820-Prymnesium_polylepis.1
MELTRGGVGLRAASVHLVGGCGRRLVAVVLERVQQRDELPAAALAVSHAEDVDVVIAAGPRRERHQAE